MRFTLPLPATWHAETLWSHLSTLSVEGLSGWSTDEELHAEFPEREELTEEAQAAVAAHVAAYVHVPTWTAVRAERVSLLVEADHRINAVLDQGQDAAPFRAYRQALRDITEAPNTPDNFTWPTKPW